MPTQETLSYIQEHKTDDPRRLALQSRPSSVDMPYALEQIAGWQAARQKLPQWAATDGVVYPPHLSMEQCSSEPTAHYKRLVAQRLVTTSAHTLVDLTGGFGVDFSYMARPFRRAVYVERQEHLCDVARHNMPLLGLPEAEVVCGDGADYLRSIDHVSMLFADPARRNSHGVKTFAISDCTPDVSALSDQLVSRADWVMIKLSPMLDWHKAVADMRHVVEVHIVSVRNECKELLLVLHNSPLPTPLRLFCVDCNGVNVDCSSVKNVYSNSMKNVAKNDVNGSMSSDIDNTEAYSIDEFTIGETSVSFVVPYQMPEVGMYLYEPNASMMKAGCFSQLSERYGVQQLERNSHLLLSREPLPCFHGRGFLIKCLSSMNKKELRRTLDGIDRANLAVRNFPLSVAELRKRLRLKEGGTLYLFATTLSDGSHALLVCEKL